VLKAIPPEGIGARELAGKFALPPDRVAAAVDSLAGEGKISVGPEGLIVINR
jgi:S1-C subfamily serine protease